MCVCVFLCVCVCDGNDGEDDGSVFDVVISFQVVGYPLYSRKEDSYHLLLGTSYTYLQYVLESYLVKSIKKQIVKDISWSGFSEQGRHVCKSHSRYGMYSILFHICLVHSRWINPATARGLGENFLTLVSSYW